MKLFPGAVSFSRAIIGTKPNLSSTCWPCHFPPTLRRALATQSNTQKKKIMATFTNRRGETVDRAVVDSVMRRRAFYTPAFEIYGGVAGLYDYGPPGCALQANLVEIWRKHFVLEEDMLEVDCSVLTPHDVFKTSGHVDKFSDWMCKDPKNGEILRADHFVEAVLEARLKGDKEARGQTVEDKEEDPKKKKKKHKSEAIKLDDAVVTEYEEILAQIDNYNGPQLGELITKYDLKNPSTGVQPSPPVPFNLMFQTAIGPSSNLPGYLRPETAQGQFLNFAKLLEFNMGNMPFASASIGKSYRNEISPRAGLLRVREFLMAEIEHFVDPEGGKKHPRFAEVANIELVLLDRHTQLSGKTITQKMTIGNAVKNKVVDNETLGYFLARIHLYLERIGADMSKVRFRQHMANEMAHYACDCWDAELQTSYGWIECVGCADRSAYDLTVHKNKTGAPLIVRQTLDEPKVEQVWALDIDKKKFGPQFKKEGRLVAEVLEKGLDQAQLEAFAKELEANGSITVNVPGIADGKATLSKDLIKIEYKTITSHIREYTPNVIEPSFGIGRILYALIEHSFYIRESKDGDEARTVLSFTPAVAPTKVLVAPLFKEKEYSTIAEELSRKLRALGISSRVDKSGASIGKRYSRNDEVGTPFGITVDTTTLEDGSVTMRDRDSMDQVRADEARIFEAVQAMLAGSKTWADIKGELPIFVRKESEEEEPEDS